MWACPVASAALAQGPASRWLKSGLRRSRDPLFSSAGFCNLHSPRWGAIQCAFPNWMTEVVRCILSVISPPYPPSALLLELCEGGKTKGGGEIYEEGVAVRGWVSMKVYVLKNSCKAFIKYFEKRNKMQNANSSSLIHSSVSFTKIFREHLLCVRQLGYSSER